MKSILIATAVYIICFAGFVSAENSRILVDTIDQKVISLESGDFNEDGITDLFVATRGSFGIDLKIYPGNFESIYGASGHFPILSPITLEDSRSFAGNIGKSKELYLRLNRDAIPDRVFISKKGELYVELSSPNATFTVNQSSDESDANTGDGACDIDTGTGGNQCTLRAAIEQANASAGPDAIEFNIPGGGIPTITPASAYPNITEPVTIDGTTQSQNLVEMNGASSNFAVGFQLNGGNSVIRGLVINRFSDAIRINGNGSNIIEGNLIGTDTAGTVALANQGGAVVVTNSINNLIGGTAGAASNLISGNAGLVAAVAIRGAASTGNVVQGNLIGTDITGIMPLGNNEGILIEGPDNTVGGTTAGARNVLADHNTAIRVSGINATGNVIQGNYIGTDITSANQLGNGTGIALFGASNNIIGGNAAAARNVISGNGTGLGISAGSGNVVQGNFIGTDASGTTAISNSIAGVIIGSSADNIIGGASAAEGNVISGSVFVGVLLSGNGAAGNQIRNNLIGVAADGTTPMGNGLHGIIFSNPTGTFPSGNLIESNTIANNQGDGVYVQGGSANSILSNSISNNGGLGIDLGLDGKTNNDSGDTDSGANNLQNFPLLTLAESSGGMTTITGSLNSTPNTSFIVEFFHDASCDPSGNGEGGTFLGSINALTNGAGTAAINAAFPGIVANGRSISATATDPAGNTSEFSACITVGGGAGGLFFDDFSDGDASDWSFTKGTWNVVTQNLTGTVNRKGDAVSPDFGGCSICTFTANLGIQTAGGRISLLAWFADKKNLVEVRLMDDRNKVLLLQKSGGFKVAKASVPMNIEPGITYNVQVSYDGANFQVIFNGTPILTEPAGAVPSGNAGVRVKSTTGTNVTGFLSDILVQ